MNKLNQIFVPKGSSHLTSLKRPILEVKEVYRGMQEALKFGWQKIQIEVDSQIIMQMLSGNYIGSSPNWQIAKEVWKIKILQEKFQ